MTDGPHSISFDPLADVYDATRGSVARGAGFARDLAPFVVGERLLEVGIGTAAVAAPLQELTGRGVAGVDISPRMLAYAVGRVGNRVALGDGERLPVRTGSVATAIVVWVLQLVPDIGRVLREVRRVLVPGGRLLAVLSQPEERQDDIEYLQRLLFERLGPRAGDGPHNVADLASENGFRVLEAAQTTEQEWDQTPAQAAERLERRWYASLLELEEARFEEVVLPIARAMRELPEPDRPRRRAGRHHFLICEAASAP